MMLHEVTIICERTVACCDNEACPATRVQRYAFDYVVAALNERDAEEQANKHFDAHTIGWRECVVGVSTRSTENSIIETARGRRMPR